MAQDPILATIAEQEWLGPIEQKGQQLVQGAFNAAGETGQVIKDALHGVWLKHPLHSAITDVPVGSWTAAAVLDVLEATGHEQYGPGADAAIAVGLAGATLAAASGLADWSDTQGEAQRVGAMHGLLNVAAAALYTGSLFARKSGRRGLGQALSLLGFGIVGASAWLGGALAYNQKIGVNHAPLKEELPEGWKPAAAEADLQEGEPKTVNVKGTPVFLLKRGDRIIAMANQCSHLGGPLSEGKVEGNTITCPWHGSCFDMDSGCVLRGPATVDQPTFAVKIQNGQVLVRA